MTFHQLSNNGHAIPDLSATGTGPHNAVIAKLPRDHLVRKRLDALGDLFDALQIRMVGRRAEDQSRNEDVELARDRLHKLRASGAGAQVIAEANSALQRASEALLASQAESGVLAGEIANLRSPLKRVPALLNDFPDGVEIPLATRPDVKRPAGGWAALAAEMQAASKAILEERKRDVAPLMEEAIEDMKRRVATLGRETSIRYEGGSIKWPTRELVCVDNSAGGTELPPRVRVIDDEAVMCRLFPEQLIAELEASIRRNYETIDLALSPDDARKRLRDLNRRLRETEAAEVEAIWRGLEAGEAVRFRPDVNVRTLLGIAPG